MANRWRLLIPMRVSNERTRGTETGTIGSAAEPSKAFRGPWKGHPRLGRGQFFPKRVVCLCVLVPRGTNWGTKECFGSNYVASKEAETSSKLLNRRWSSQCAPGPSYFQDRILCLRTSITEHLQTRERLFRTI